jgi:hypothetical protein
MGGPPSGGAPGAVADSTSARAGGGCCQVTVHSSSSVNDPDVLGPRTVGPVQRTKPPDWQHHRHDWHHHHHHHCTTTLPGVGVGPSCLSRAACRNQREPTGQVAREETLARTRQGLAQPSDQAKAGQQHRHQTLSRPPLVLRPLQKQQPDNLVLHTKALH